MLDFDTAQARLIAAGRAPEQTESVSLADCLGRVAAETIQATLDLPPADNSAMDGYAIRQADYQADTPLPIQQQSFAGEMPEALKPGHCIRLYTGSLMPAGADTVIMQEHVTVAEEAITIDQAPQQGQHVRLRGEDVSAGDVIVESGTLLQAGEVALLASQGIASVSVYHKLRIGLLTTGDELVAPGQPRAPEQIYNSNAPMLASLIAQLGAVPHRVLHAADTQQELTAAFDTLLAECDLVLTVGGVSVGDKDLVKPTIEALGGELDLWRVRMKPGRPVALAHAHSIPIVCLPGNPVSAYVVFAMLVAPVVRAMQGRTDTLPRLQYGQIQTPRTLGGWREEFIRTRIHEQADGLPRIEPHSDQGSAIIHSLAWADGLARIPADASIEDGDIVSFYTLKDCFS